MAPGPSRWGDSGRRHPPESYRRDDRDRPPRDNYRDRSPIRGRGSPRGRGPSHDGFRRRASSYRNNSTRGSLAQSPPHEPAARRSSPQRATPLNVDKAPEQASTAQNPPKSDTYAAQNAGDMKLLTKLICERVSWMQKKEAADKRLEKLRADHDRSGPKHADFPSILELFQDQMKTATSEVLACTKNIWTIDEKLKSGFGHLSPTQILTGLAGQTGARGKQEPTSSVPSNPDKQPTQSRGTILESLKPLLDKELNQFRNEIGQSVRELKTEAESANKAAKQLESENQKLRTNQDEMTQKIKQLEESLSNLERKYDGGQAKVNCRLDAVHEQVKEHIAAINEVQAKSETRVSNTQFEKAIQEQNDKIISVQRRLDPALSQIEHLKENMSSKVTALEEKQIAICTKVDEKSSTAELNQAVSDHKTRLSEQNSRIDSLAGEISALQPLASAGLVAKMTRVVDDVSKIQERLKADRANPKPALRPDPIPDPMAEEKVRAVMAPALAKLEKDVWPILQQRLNKVAESLGGFIDKERVAREETKGQVLGLADQVKVQVDQITALNDRARSLGQALDGLRMDLARLKETMDSQAQQRGGDEEMRNHSISTLRGQIEEVDQELKKGQESLQMQVLHLSKWANNFNTRKLYTDIVSHINATIPTGVSVGNQMRTLETRLDMLENRDIQEDKDDPSGVKKRKALNGTAVVVNNSR